MYEYTSNSLLLKEDYSRYDETVEVLFEGLGEQVEPEDVSAKELLQDDGIRVPKSVFEGEVRVEPLNRYRIEELGERRTVYTFEHSLGIEVVGDYSMMREALPEYVPSSIIPMQELEAD